MLFCFCFWVTKVIEAGYFLKHCRSKGDNDVHCYLQYFVGLFEQQIVFCFCLLVTRRGVGVGM